MSEDSPFVKMMSLESDYATLGEKKIDINKRISKIDRRAREQSKASICCVCGRSCTSFCNSHSVPHFSLNRIAENGKVAQVLQGEIPTMGDETGLNRAGTFRLICRDCDSTIFQEYETPNAYTKEPTEKMLAQIAMKNTLHMISKRKYEIALYNIVEQEFGNFHSLGSGKSIEEIDLAEYQSSLQYAINSLSIGKGGRYHIYFYRILDYVVPLATQASLCLIGDFEDRIINNIYNLSEDLQTPSIHVAVFPLEKTSIILLFVESNNNRYRKMFRQLNKLEPGDQLAAINYMIFSYTENVFLSPSVYATVREHPEFMNVCRKTTTTEGLLLSTDPIKVAIKEFSLSKRNLIPNLLSREFALTVP